MNEATPGDVTSRHFRDFPQIAELATLLISTNGDVLKLLEDDLPGFWEIVESIADGRLPRRDQLPILKQSIEIAKARVEMAERSLRLNSQAMQDLLDGEVIVTVTETKDPPPSA